MNTDLINATCAAAAAVLHDRHPDLCEGCHHSDGAPTGQTLYHLFLHPESGGGTLEGNARAREALRRAGPAKWGRIGAVVTPDQYRYLDDPAADRFTLEMRTQDAVRYMLGLDDSGGHPDSYDHCVGTAALTQFPAECLLWLDQEDRLKLSLAADTSAKFCVK